MEVRTSVLCGLGVFLGVSWGHCLFATCEIILQNCLVSSDAPKPFYKTVWCLRTLRNHFTKLFGAFGRSEAFSQNCLVLSDVPKPSRKTVYPFRSVRSLPANFLTPFGASEAILYICFLQICQYYGLRPGVCLPFGLQIRKSPKRHPEIRRDIVYQILKIQTIR